MIIFTRIFDGLINVIGLSGGDSVIKMAMVDTTRWRDGYGVMGDG
jgi:hypothetical protein